MSWQVGSTLVVCLVVLVGFVWFERSKPPSKLIALTASLAALAIAGRVLTPLPNVQATTDITILSGYVLGAGPGFLIGSIAALVSNVFLGQGPWTPWEMLGWGAAGVSGALLARATSRRLTRFPLAISCAIVGLAYGLWMDLSVLLTFSAERSEEGYLAIAAASLPFNLAHAAGNFVLCLLFGPAFIRLLERFRRRLDLSWRARGSKLSGDRTQQAAAG